MRGGIELGGTVTTEIVVSLVVDEDKDDVRAWRPLRCRSFRVQARNDRGEECEEDGKGAKHGKHGEREDLSSKVQA